MEEKDLTVAETMLPTNPDSEKTIEELTSEIQYYLVQMGQNAIEVGKRLILAKSKLSHGEWQNWLVDNFNLSQRTARQFMQMAERFQNGRQSAVFSQSQMAEMLALPEAETEKFIEVKALEGTPVEDMTVKKLREEIKKYKTGLSESKQEENVEVETPAVLNESEKIEMADVDLEIENDAVEENLKETPLESSDPLPQEEKFGKVVTSQIEIQNKLSEKEEVDKGVEDLEKFLTLMNLLKNNKNLRKVVEIYAAKDVKEFENQLSQLTAFNSELKSCLAVWKKQQDKNMSRKAIIAALKQIALSDEEPFEKSKFIRDSVSALGFASVHNTPTKELLRILNEVSQWKN